MRYIDFKYDGSYLSDYGFIICDFEYDNNATDLDIGSVISFNKISHNYGQKYTLSSTQFEDCITASFDICKNPDLYEGDEMQITSGECRDILRWLNRRDFNEFAFCEDNEKGTHTYYNASFNIKKITINDKLFGFRLAMETDSPFAYGEEIVKSFSCTGENDIKSIDDMSQDIGFTFPTLEIKCLESGNLTLYNMTNSETTYIKNVSNGETINIDSLFQIITSDMDGHKIFDDFNFVFFHIGNTYNDVATQFYASLNCDIKIKYRPKIKDTL